MAVPDQVVGLSATPRNGEVFLVWDIPNDNGDGITDYKTEFKLTSSGTWLIFVDGVAPLPSTPVTNLTNGESYDFRVSAINAAGTGSVSVTTTTTPISGNFTTTTNVLLILKDHGADVDLSTSLLTGNYEDGIPQSLKVTLSAPYGEFFTRGAKIKQGDRIYIQITDARGNVLKDVFHVRKIKRSRKGGKGQKLTLICPHQSEYLWRRNISLFQRRVSGKEAVNQIIVQLNSDKGDSDPSVNTNTTFDPVTKKGVALDDGTSNTFIFEKKKLQEAFDKITDIEAQPPEGGGSFEPFYIRFKSDYKHDTNELLDQVSIQAYPQGFVQNTTSATFTNIPNVTLKHGVISDETTNTFENDSDEDPELATNLHLICGQKAGDFLGDWAKYYGAKRVFDNARRWNPTSTFKKGALVNEAGLVYEATVESTNQQPPNALFWIQRTFTPPLDWGTGNFYNVDVIIQNNNIAYKSLQAHTSTTNDEPPNADFWRRISFLPTTDYSPLTKQKIQYWVNAFGGSKHAATQNGQCAMLDPNIVVKDKFHPRTMVRIVRSNPASIPSSHKPNGLIPDGYRILVINAITGAEESTGDFVGNDPNGIPFAGNIAEYIDPNKDNTGDWFVFKAKQTLQDQEVYDHEEGLPWTKFPGTPIFTLTIPDRFVDADGVCRFVIGLAEAPRSTVWEIGSYGIFEVPLVGQNAVFFGATSPEGAKQFDCAHSIKWDSINSRIDAGNKKISNDDVDSNSAVFVKADASGASSEQQNPFFVGFNFFPGIFPVTSNAIPFGPVEAGEKINTGTFDLDNMTRTADGSISWFGPKSEQYRPIQSLATIFQFIDTFTASDSLQSEGDYEIGIFLIDRRDNTRILPFTQGKNNDIIPQEGLLPGNFYSGVSGSSSTFSAAEPEPTDAFDKNNILFGGIYTRDSHDSQGRYKSGSTGALFSQILGGKVNRFVFSTQLEMALDGFRLTKPLYVTNLDEPNSLPERNIDAVDQKKLDITSYQTAKNLIKGLARIFAFKQQRFEIDMGGRCDIQQGDPVYYTDTEQVDETTDSLPNTLKMVHDKTTYTLSKTIDGPAGFLAKASIVGRLYPEET